MLDNNLYKDLTNGQLASFSNIQNKIRDALTPMVEFQLEYSKQMASINKSLSALRQAISDSMQPYNEAVEKIKQSQINLLKELQLANKLQSTLPTDESLKVQTLYSTVVDKLEEDKLFDEILISNKPKEIVDKNALTLEQLITIISFVLSLILFIQAQLPNKQIEEISKSLTQLVEIEMQQLESIQQMEDQMKKE